ncbi:putative mitogen-activated protein kinase kinase kinase NPK1 [Iris pallida]|uniref:Mitogen-activated protein kinase kinase kinase NPK1 n=1 Tax=Iris pallida TaxID=29817 RepID=A0AAX6FC26_IRIPA|nr:putative mitogen-activated protein kinase kinase kinase NPK1 [Iris pallida]
MAFGGWTRGRVLGRGSTATVSLATSDRSGEQFAVKSAELAGSSFLRRERKILSSLGSCKNVVSYLGCDDTADGQYNIFLEYAPGGSLHDRIAERAAAGGTSRRPRFAPTLAGSSPDWPSSTRRRSSTATSRAGTSSLGRTGRRRSRTSAARSSWKRRRRSCS